jgi:hypothetical protein
MDDIDDRNYRIAGLHTPVAPLDDRLRRFLESKEPFAPPMSSTSEAVLANITVVFRLLLRQREIRGNGHRLMV